MNKGKLGELPIDVKKNTVETRFIKKYYINKFNFMNLGIYKNEIVIIKNIASEDKLNEYIMTYNIDGFPSIIEYSIENSTINKDKNYYKVILNK